MGRSRASKEQMGMSQAPCKKAEGGVPEKAKSAVVKKQAQMVMRNRGEKSQ